MQGNGIHKIANLVVKLLDKSGCCALRIFLDEARFLYIILNPNNK